MLKLRVPYRQVTVGVLRERLSRQEQAAASTEILKAEPEEKAMARLRRESSLGVSEARPSGLRANRAKRAQDSGAHGALARPPVPAPFAQGRQGGALRGAAQVWLSFFTRCPRYAGLAKGIGSGYACHLLRARENAEFRCLNAFARHRKQHL